MKLFVLILCVGYIAALPDEKSGTCTPLESWKIDCNTCFCPASGIYSRAGCTVLECGTSKTCMNPGEKWKELCNDCFCSQSGIAICSNRRC